MFGVFLHISLVWGSFCKVLIEKHVLRQKPAQNNKCNSANMDSSDKNAREGILSLLFDLPEPVKNTYLTTNEIVRLLKRGGVSPSLESSLVSSALRRAGPKYRSRFEYRRPEKVPGLEGQNSTYRLQKKEDNASPRSQRTGKRSLPSVIEHYFQNDEKYRPHLNAILKYYSDKNSSGGRSSTPTAAAAASTDEAAASVPTITLGALNGSREIAEIEQRHQMFCQLHASCGDLRLLTEPVRKGFGIRETWHCDNCGADFVHDTFFYQKSKVVADGKSHSRKSVGLNLDVTEALEDEGVYPQRMTNIFVKADIVHPTVDSFRQLEKKCRKAAIEAGAECIQENVAEAYGEADNYITFEREGVIYKAAVVTVAQDGSSLKRDYSHNFTGSAVAQIAVEKTTNKVVGLRISQSLCRFCILAFNKRLREMRRNGEQFSKSDLKEKSQEELYALMKHDGPCYRNSTHSPGTAEEYLAEAMGRLLLIDDDGDVQENPLFVQKHVADGDSKGITRAAAAQLEIVGEEALADFIVELCRDWNHLQKLIVAEWRKFLNEEKFGPVPNNRLNHMANCVKLICKRYKENAIDPPNVTDKDKKKHLSLLQKELQSVVRHEAGLHTHCTTNTCKLIRLSKANPSWTNKQLDNEWAKQNQYQGQLLEISDGTIEDMTKSVTKRINSRTADSNCKLESTTGVEQANGMITKYTMGKRLNEAAADGYLNACNRGIGHLSKGMEYEQDILDKLGSKPSPTRDAGFAAIEKKRERDHARKSNEDYAVGIKESKRFRGALRNRSDKEGRGRKYGTGKDTSAGPIKRKKKEPVGEKKVNRCGNCGQREPRHSAATCPYDKTDDVVVVNGKLPSKRKKAPTTEPATKSTSKKKAKANFGVSVDDIDSWLPSVRRDNGSA